MNPTSFKLFEGFTGLLYKTSHSFRNFGPVKSAINYGAYFGYLSHNWAPRISYLETTTPAYTLQKNKLAIYIIYGLVGGFLFHQCALDKRSASKAQKHYLSLRN